MHVKFSICIPNFNYANYLSNTLRSALDQTYGDFEVLVADNASTDASVDVVRAANDPRVDTAHQRTQRGICG